MRSAAPPPSRASSGDAAGQQETENGATPPSRRRESPPAAPAGRLSRRARPPRFSTTAFLLSVNEPKRAVSVASKYESRRCAQMSSIGVSSVFHRQIHIVDARNDVPHVYCIRVARVSSQPPPRSHWLLSHTVYLRMFRYRFCRPKWPAFSLVMASHCFRCRRRSSRVSHAAAGLLLNRRRRPVAAEPSMPSFVSREMPIIFTSSFGRSMTFHAIELPSEASPSTMTCTGHDKNKI